MNYRHAYHAGNHADVLKHMVLARLIEHLKKKDKAFRIIDLHAGIGVYDLNADAATRTGEWRLGIGRLFDGEGASVPLPGMAEELIAPWRNVIPAINGDGPLRTYPGSPEFARRLKRKSDRLMLNELHPADFASLHERYGRDRSVTLTDLDAAIAIKAQLPPTERRGLVLLDPPYERADERNRTLKSLRDGLQRFGTGIFCLWYPITGDGLSDALVDGVRANVPPKTLHAELVVRAVVQDGGLAGSGLVIVNAPWTLDEELEILLPALRDRLAQAPEARSKVEWLRRD
ncbi:MAG: 23S rRNA (adenine(2030)-N(6))-methyltransferase RlmJ [Rhizobiales bacterium]|nr:23S rRNA (adenine(2030)-N(6))-methyltransferase RlmJ [Hyphomicrobiales bacterium]